MKNLGELFFDRLVTVNFGTDDFVTGNCEFISQDLIVLNIDNNIELYPMCLISNIESEPELLAE